MRQVLEVVVHNWLEQWQKSWTRRCRWVGHSGRLPACGRPLILHRNRASSPTTGEGRDRSGTVCAVHSFWSPVCCKRSKTGSKKEIGKGEGLWTTNQTLEGGQEGGLWMTNQTLEGGQEGGLWTTNQTLEGGQGDLWTTNQTLKGGQEGGLWTTNQTLEGGRRRPANEATLSALTCNECIHTLFSKFIASNTKPILTLHTTCYKSLIHFRCFKVA